MILATGNTTTNGQISLGSPTTSVLVQYIHVVATQTEANATVTLFKTNNSTAQSNKVCIVSVPADQLAYSEIYGHDSESGILFQNGMSLVTGSNVSWSNIGYRLSKA